MNTDYPIAHEFFAEIWRALDGDEAWLDQVRFDCVEIRANSAGAGIRRSRRGPRTSG